MIISDEEKRIAAVHEAGHAMLTVLLPHADPIHKVTIIPRGIALALTQQLPTDEKHQYSRDDLDDQIAIREPSGQRRSCGFCLPHDPPDPHEHRRGDVYCARGDHELPITEVPDVRGAADLLDRRDVTPSMGRRDGRARRHPPCAPFRRAPRRHRVQAGRRIGGRYREAPPDHARGYLDQPSS